MIITVRVSKSGNSKVVSIPKTVIDYYDLKIGDYVEIDIRKI